MTHDVHPDLAGRAKWIPRISFTRRNLRFARFMLRLLTPRPLFRSGVRVERRVEGGLALRVYTPTGRTPDAALLWIHGGGLITGAPEQEDARCFRFVRELGVLVVSPAYRLAPEHPFPAAIDDCHAAWHAATRLAHAAGVDAGRIALAGESAGGGLAASLAQRVYDEHGPQPAAQLLVSPMLDDRTAARPRTDVRDDVELDEHLVWNRRSNRTGWSSYLGRPPGLSRVPQYAVPARRADLSGLPPAWIGTGTLDLFLAESRDYAQRLERAGVRCRLNVVEGAFHGFDTVAPGSPVATRFIDSQLRFLQERLGLS